MERQEHGYERPNSIKSLAMIRTRTIVGVRAISVMVEVHLANGLPSFSTVGLPETAVKESKDRVRGAIINSGFEFPAKRITVNLAPADLPKTGGRFDLPIAIGILIASGQLPNVGTEHFEMMGELALDGQLRKVSGILPSSLSCGHAGRQLIIPLGNADEASLAETTRCWGASHLLEVCQHLVGKGEMVACKAELFDPPSYASLLDLADVKGQARGKRAIEIAASGGHSLLLIGPPGTGKSMLASRLPGILPALTLDQALETAAIQSIANGEFNRDQWSQRPFRSPHHSASSVALVGGGTYPKPGEISLAHNGVLFLDELPEFSRLALEQLREPLETGKIHIARANQSAIYPARFQLVAACNPCPCGYLGDDTDRCGCSNAKIQQYRSKLSGPILDRIDMHVHLPRVAISAFRQPCKQMETSQIVRRRAVQVRDVQYQRQGKLNNDLNSHELEHHCFLSDDLHQFLETASERLHLSARAYHRILRLARTLADMTGRESIVQQDLAEALSLRLLDRSGFA